MSYVCTHVKFNAWDCDYVVFVLLFITCTHYCNPYVFFHEVHKICTEWRNIVVWLVYGQYKLSTERMSTAIFDENVFTAFFPESHPLVSLNSSHLLCSISHHHEIQFATYYLPHIGLPKTSTHYILTMKMATVVFAETSDNSEHSTQLIAESCKCTWNSATKI
jgi:hypothetical protein